MLIVHTCEEGLNIAILGTAHLGEGLLEIVLYIHTFSRVFGIDTSPALFSIAEGGEVDHGRVGEALEE